MRRDLSLPLESLFLLCRRFRRTRGYDGHGSTDTASAAGFRRHHLRAQRRASSAVPAAAGCHRRRPRPWPLGGPGRCRRVARRRRRLHRLEGGQLGEEAVQRHHDQPGYPGADSQLVPCARRLAAAAAAAGRVLPRRLLPHLQPPGLSPRPRRLGTHVRLQRALHAPAHRHALPAGPQLSGVGARLPRCALDRLASAAWQAVLRRRGTGLHHPPRPRRPQGPLTAAAARRRPRRHHVPATRRDGRLWRRLLCEGRPLGGDERDGP